jgi:acid phosphatase type 7
MKFRCRLIGVSWVVALGVVCHGHDHRVDASPRPSSDASETTFLVKPYLQLGNVSPGRVTDELVLLWHADLGEAVWAVEYQAGVEAVWRLSPPPASHRSSVPGIAPHRLFRVALTGLVPGKEFAYRVRKGGEIIFAAAARAPKGTDQPYRYVSFGDCGAGTAPQKAVAYQTHLARPDFLIITGDIVYGRGRISEYREKFWPVYNAEVASPLLGAPLLRSTLFVAAPGNHDIATRDLEKYPDGLAYFLYWDQPRNGPLGVQGGPLVPPLIGPVANRQAFVVAAGDTYPRMANFSFNTLTVADVDGTTLAVRQVSMNGAELDRFTITK